MGWTIAFSLVLNVLSLDSKVCVVSLFGESVRPGFHQSVNDEIIEDARNRLKALGYENPSDQFTLKKDSLAQLRECLQSPQYEEIIVLGHSRRMSNGAHALMDSTRKPTLPVSSQFFSSIRIGDNLKQFTLISCHSELVEKVYASWFARLREAKVNIRFQPVSLSADTLAQVSETGPQLYRHQSLMGAMIAEAAQDPEAQSIFCILEQRYEGMGNRKDQSCLRGHYRLKITDDRSGTGRTIQELYFSRPSTRDLSEREGHKTMCSDLQLEKSILNIKESAANLSAGSAQYYLERIR